ncbi:hypothetical protein C0Q70_08114 [Pomacea canaliculata]|uniref:Uncharacterized protein n=1 Tax=Pomacea canaliculata TaxID=400727 RepID=A0A2T7PGX2_POMCA|nr:hypothetical protein C0Q70_08114 [Pomacea canaliculata]
MTRDKREQFRKLLQACDPSRNLGRVGMDRRSDVRGRDRDKVERRTRQPGGPPHVVGAVSVIADDTSSDGPRG